MKKLSVHFLVLASFIVTSCNEFMEERNTNPNEVETICAKIKGFEYDTDDFSRTFISIEQDGPHYAWAVTDTIGIFPSEGRQVEFSMSSGAGSASAVFTGGGWGLKSTSTYAAYFPLIGQYYLDKSDIPVHYTGQVQEGDASTAHLGVYDYLAAPASEVKNGGVSFDFERLGCLVQIQLTVPSPTTIYSVTLKAENEAFAVKGKVDLTESSPRIYPVASSSEIMLEVKNVTTAESNQVATFYMMLPPTDLSGKTLKAVVSVENGSKEVSLASKNFQAGKAYALSATLGDDWISETDYVDLKFGMTGVTTSYNTGNGSLSITYPSGSLPNVKVGNATVLPAEYGFDIRVIESVNTSGNTISMQTSQGNMSNLFRNTSFTLTTDASATRSAEDNVYTPTAYGYIDESGKYHEVYNDETGTRSQYSVNVDFWKFNSNFNGQKIYEGTAGTLSWDKCEFFAGLNGNFTFDFGHKKISKARTIGDLKKFSYKLSGNFGMDMKLHYNYAHEFKEEVDTIIKYNVIPTGVIKFTVGTVPVVVLVYTHLGRQYTCNIQGQLDATTGVKLANEVSIGLEWTPSGGVIPTSEFNPTFNLYPPTMEVNASAEGKVTYYPQVEIGIYKFLGPWFEPRPYLKEKVDAGLRASTDGNTYCGWNAGTYCGMDFRMGLELDFGFWRKDVWTSDVYNCVKDQLLLNAPDSIRLLTPEKNISVKKGENITAEFVIESYSPLTKKYYPCPFALVNFSTESGVIDKTLAIADITGKVSLTWTPCPMTSGTSQTTGVETTNRMLVAKVVDKNGKTINESNLTVNVKAEGSDSEPEKPEKNDSIRLREALIQLYKSTNGDNWRRNDNWCSEKPITEWYGVSYRYGYEFYIDLWDNNLTGNIEQTFVDSIPIFLEVSWNNLSDIKVSTLSSLRCCGNPLNSLDLSNNINLRELDCSGNNLTSLDLSNNINLRELYCSDNNLASLDLSNNINLQELQCSDCSLTSLDLTNNTMLRSVQCIRNQLTNLDISRNSLLVNLHCEENKLTSLELSNNIFMDHLYCDNNKLSSLNISEQNFVQLTCSNNNIESLNLSNCTNLSWLCCENNKLESLNLSNCTNLSHLNCSDNPVRSLVGLSFLYLEYLNCRNTRLTGLITDAYKQIKQFYYDPRYYYGERVVDSNGNITVKPHDNGYGWWYPGEPERGYHYDWEKDW